ncbi:MAG: hypothetical protein Q7T56_05495, partial [Nocardioidaceae bacterium]|nr:hypothetical protein [Nocardioidaceae bacterium]
MALRRARLRRVGVGVVLATAGTIATSACTSGGAADPVTGASPEPASTAPASPTVAPTPVEPPATPSAFSTAAGPTGLTFRDYLGASVPAGAAGPTSAADGTASGWRRDDAGAVLAAAHVAVAA